MLFFCLFVLDVVFLMLRTAVDPNGCKGTSISAWRTRKSARGPSKLLPFAIVVSNVLHKWCLHHMFFEKTEKTSVRPTKTGLQQKDENLSDRINAVMDELPEKATVVAVDDLRGRLLYHVDILENFHVRLQKETTSGSLEFFCGARAVVT